MCANYKAMVSESTFVGFGAVLLGGLMTMLGGYVAQKRAANTQMALQKQGHHHELRMRIFDRQYDRLFKILRSMEDAGSGALLLQLNPQMDTTERERLAEQVLASVMSTTAEGVSNLVSYPPLYNARDRFLGAIVTLMRSDVPDVEAAHAISELRLSRWEYARALDIMTQDGLQPQVWEPQPMTVEELRRARQEASAG